MNQYINLLLFILITLFLNTSGNSLSNTDEENSHDHILSRTKRSRRRNFIVKCCGHRSCTRPVNNPNAVTSRRNTPTPWPGDINLGNQSPPISCAQINFATLSTCCRLHPSIFEFMDPDIRTCANKTTKDADFFYYKAILNSYMLNQAVTQKNKLDLRRIPNAVKFFDCFFKERDWIAQPDRGQIFNPDMIDEFIDNVDASWDDVLTDGLSNCSKVIKSLVPWPYMQLSGSDSTRQVYQTYPILVAQCMRKVLLSYCPRPNLPIIDTNCNGLRDVFKKCDPFPQTNNPPEDDDYEDDNGDDYYEEEDYNGNSSNNSNNNGNNGNNNGNNGNNNGNNGNNDEYYDENDYGYK